MITVIIIVIDWLHCQQMDKEEGTLLPSLKQNEAMSGLKKDGQNHRKLYFMR